MTRRSRPDQGKMAARRAARLAAVQGLYEIDMTGAAVDTVLLDALRNRWSETPYGSGETAPDSGPRVAVSFDNYIEIQGHYSQL